MLSEAECYERLYGWRHTEDSVKVVARDSLQPVDDEFGERMRALLELRLDDREPEAA